MLADSFFNSAKRYINYISGIAHLYIKSELCLATTILFVEFAFTFHFYLPVHCFSLFCILSCENKMPQFSYKFFLFLQLDCAYFCGVNIKQIVYWENWEKWKKWLVCAYSMPVKKGISQQKITCFFYSCNICINPPLFRSLFLSASISVSICLLVSHFFKGSIPNGNIIAKPLNEIMITVCLRVNENICIGVCVCVCFMWMHLLITFISMPAEAWCIQNKDTNITTYYNIVE